MPPPLLTDQHLFAEYRELPRVSAYLTRALAAHGGREGVLARIPGRYVLGKGHVTFFYDKGAFLAARHAALVEELRRRDFRLSDPCKARDETIWTVFRAADLYATDWRATPPEIRRNVARLLAKVAAKGNFYRLYKTPLGAAELPAYRARLLAACGD